jgi:hypothetical protein
MIKHPSKPISRNATRVHSFRLYIWFSVLNNYNFNAIKHHHRCWRQLRRMYTFDDNHMKYTNAGKCFNVQTFLIDYIAIVVGLIDTTRISVNILLFTCCRRWLARNQSFKNSKTKRLQYNFCLYENRFGSMFLYNLRKTKISR